MDHINKDMSYSNFWLNKMNNITKPLIPSQDDRYLKDVSAEIMKYLEKYGYLITSEIGRGGYGVVYKARLNIELLDRVVEDSDSENQESYSSLEINDSTKGSIHSKRRNLIKVAIKTMFSTTYPEVVLSELCFLRILNGKEHMPILIDSFFENQKAHIVFEYFKHDLFIVSIRNL